MSVILDGEPCAFADAAHTQTQDIAAVGVQRPVRILAGCYKRAAHRKHRGVIDNSDARRRAARTADELGTNRSLCGSVR